MPQSRRITSITTASKPETSTGANGLVKMLVMAILGSRLKRNHSLATQIGPGELERARLPRKLFAPRKTRALLPRDRKAKLASRHQITHGATAKWIKTLMLARFCATALPPSLSLKLILPASGKTLLSCHLRKSTTPSARTIKTLTGASTHASTVDITKILGTGLRKSNSHATRRGQTHPGELEKA